MLHLFMSAAVLAAQGVSGITPAAVARMIDRDGAKGTVEKLSNTAADHTQSEFGLFDKVLDGISSGEARWLALVPRLAPGTDAATAESLPIALADALPKNPAGVLRLIRRDASWLGACGYPMIEPTDKEMHAYFKATIPAVRSVHEPALQAAKRLA